MRSAFKGFVIEDMISTTSTVILMAFFAVAMINNYQDYLKKMDSGEQSNLANSLAGKIFFENNGIIMDTSPNLSPSENIQVSIYNIETGQNYTYGSIKANASSTISSSRAILLYLGSGNQYFPAMLEVKIGR